MDSGLKKILRAISLELRHVLEGRYDDQGRWLAGDLERRLNELGVWRDRPAKPLAELSHLSTEDKAARHVVDGYLRLRDEAGVARNEAVTEFVREAAYTWANRLFALRCMEARGIIDEVILQKETYSGRSLMHSRFARRNPEACAGEDDGLFAVLFTEFTERAADLPVLFNPHAPAVALRPSVTALKRCIALLSGREAVRGQEPASDAVFEAPDAFGWAYQYWNVEEKERVFEMVRTKKGAKIEGADIIPATCIYTEPYMVKFLVQNSLGALWMGMHPESPLCQGWEYYVKDADRAPVEKKLVAALTFLDPACGSGHFLLEAFDLLYAMYEEEGELKEPSEISTAILNHNLFGIDIDERAVQIAEAALWMKAKEKAPDLDPAALESFRDHLAATNIRLPKGKDHLQAFVKKHTEDRPLRTALEAVFQGLENAPELGSLLQIEEPVEKELQYLKAKSEEDKGKLEQQALFAEVAQPKQEELPLGIESYEQWKARTLLRLKAHFGAEAEAADPMQVFFGQSAEKGLVLFDLVSRRYDVVAANPPYMGSKNMGMLLKSYVAKYYVPGKRDLYAAFILLCHNFTRQQGRVAMVTQQSWMFQRSYADLRAMDEDKISKAGENIFKGLLLQTSIETLVHLGPRAFNEISGEVVNITLFTLVRTTPVSEHRLTAFRLDDIENADQKADVLLNLLAPSSVGNGRYYRQNQCGLTKIFRSPLIYFLGKKYLDHLTNSLTLRRFSDIRQGVATTADPRYVRMIWEVTNRDRWLPFEKGEGYARWTNVQHYVVEWEIDGIRIKTRIDQRQDQFVWTMRMPKSEAFFRDGLCFSTVARGALGARFITRSIFSSKSPFISLRSGDYFALASLMNSRLASYFLRAISQGIEFGEGYVRLLPVCKGVEQDKDLALIGECCYRVRRAQFSRMLLDKSFHPSVFPFSNLDHLQRNVDAAIDKTFIADIARFIAEGYGENIVADYYGLTHEEIVELDEHVGKHVAQFPLLVGYHATLPEVQEFCKLPTEYWASLRRLNKLTLSRPELTDLKQRLHTLYETGPGTISISNDEKEERPTDSENEDSEETDISVEAGIPIPTETFLEELSVRLGIHPLSVYWLLKESREKGGLRCLTEEKHFIEDTFTVVVLRLLGHRWPKQIEAGEQLPDWADRDGIIPITEGSGEKTLVERVRERIAEEFPSSSTARIGREFEEIIGTSLEKWLAGPFFKSHISQYKKRPIAWQVELGTRGWGLEAREKEPGTRGKRKASGYSSGSVFSCLVYYHKLNADLLPKIRSQYIGLLKSGYETELRALERIESPTTDQSARKVQLTNWIDDLKALDENLSEVIVSGFGPESLLSQLRQLAIDDAMFALKARWLRKLVGVVREGPLESWKQAACETELHPEFSGWIYDALTHLDHYCSAVGPKAPEEKTLSQDPDSAYLAALICREAEAIVGDALTRACQIWWKQFDEAVIAPIRRQSAELNEQIKLRKDERDLVDLQTIPYRRVELEREIKELKDQVSALRYEHAQKVAAGQRIRTQIEGWTCPEAERWEPWLAAQPLYDQISSLDGRRSPPRTVAEFIAQESAYAPDINDGVRVNVAPLQRAGLLPAEVIAKKDVDKAIADRAEWRADERRWCREGKLPCPGWWKKESTPLEILEAAT